jgi:hypothetical protein
MTASRNSGPRYGAAGFGRLRPDGARTLVQGRVATLCGHSPWAALGTHELRILDIQTWNRTLLYEALEKEVDFLVFVLPVSNRVHVRELEEIRALPKELPSLVVISKWDLAVRPGETHLCEIVRSRTGRPAVVFSRELAQTCRLMNQMLCDLRTLYKRPTSRLRALFGWGNASK